MRATTTALVFAAALCARAGGAAAWDGPGQWWKPAHDKDPGGGGIYGTGGQGDYGIKCTDCHVKPKEIIDASVTPLPAWGMLGAAKTYTPGRRYEITVRLLKESLGMSGCGPYVGHVNNFVGTFEDGAGKPAGMLETDSGRKSTACPKAAPDPKTASGTTWIYGDCRAVIPTHVPDGTTQWKFYWTAPPVGAGDVTFFAGVGDGNCEMNSTGDDMKMLTLKLSQGMAMSGPKSGAATGGAAPGRAFGLALPAFAAVIVPGARRLSRRRR